MENTKTRVFAPFVGSGLESWIGGGPVVFFELLRAMQQDGGFEVTVAATSGGLKMMQNYFQNESEVLDWVSVISVRASFFLQREPFPLYRIWSYTLSFLQLMFFLPRRAKFDTGLCPSDFFFHLIPLRRMKKKGVIRRMYSHIFHRIPEPAQRSGSRLFNRLSYLQQQNMFRLLLQYADGLIISDTQEGHEIGEYFTQRNYPAKIIYFRLGVSLKKISDYPAAEQSYDIVHIGLRPNKGVYDLPGIWQRFRAACPGRSLCIIGGGPEQLRQEIGDAFEKMGAGQEVTFAGFVEDAVKFGLLKSARLFIAPSHEEGWGLAVGEALACGLPVVAYRLKAYTSAFGETVTYTGCYSQEEFADNMIKLWQDQELLEQKSRAGLKKMQEYDWPRLFRQELSVLKNT